MFYRVLGLRLRVQDLSHVFIGFPSESCRSNGWFIRVFCLGSRVLMVLSLLGTRTY